MILNGNIVIHGINTKRPFANQAKVLLNNLMPIKPMEAIPRNDDFISGFPESYSPLSVCSLFYPTLNG
jgi:hypothetical protein